MGLEKRKGTWCFVWWENRKRKLRSLATGDKREAEMRAAKFRNALRARRGGFDSFDETESLPVTELVDEYAKELKRRGRSDAHAEKTRRRVRLVLEGARSIGELTADRLRARLARLAEIGNERKGFKGTMPAQPFSAKTANDYRAALHGFFGWLVSEGRWHENPVVRIKRTAAGDPTRERSALTPENLEILLASAPFERATRVAATTGLRRGELKSLRWSDVDLAAGTVTVRAGSAKNRRAATLPLPAGTIAALEQLKGGALPTAPVFSVIPLIRTFYKDLRRAGLQASEEFEGVDFHALRATFATSLARAGVPLSQAQRLMRHSTPTLTSNVYTKFELVDAHAAVAKVDPAEVAPPSGKRQGRDRVKAGTTYDGSMCDLGGGGSDVKTRKLAVTPTNSQDAAAGSSQPNAAGPHDLKQLHPAGFEPARWGSKPHILSVR
jgi:integrase